MEHAKVRITEDELAIMTNAEFFRSKKVITETISNIFATLRDELRNCAKESAFIFPEGADVSTGKLSKGENYRNLPYIILDFPKLFSKENIFAFRTMFWWGNHFSFHLHLSGEFFHENIEKVIPNIARLNGQNFYFSVNDSQWEYYFDETNLHPIENFAQYKDEIRKKSFLKISRKLDLKDWKKVVPYGTETLALCLNLLK